MSKASPQPICPEAQLTLQGAICLDTLGSAWSPVLTIKSALLSLQSLLSTPEPKDPQDAEVATMLMNHPEQFDRVAREWSVKYASAPQRILTQTVNFSTSKSQKPPKSKEQELREQMARCSSLLTLDHSGILSLLQIPGIQQGPYRSLRQHGI
jgi:hypothetical protein